MLIVIGYFQREDKFWKEMPLYYSNASCKFLFKIPVFFLIFSS